MQISFNIRSLGNKCHLCKEGSLHCIGTEKGLFKASLIVNLVFASSDRNICLKMHVPLISLLFFYNGIRFRVEKS